MPWHIEKDDGKFCVVKDSDGSTEKCHDTETDAEDHMAALYAAEERKSMSQQIREAWNNFKAILDGFFNPPDKERQWDGSASNYEDTEQYCKACLINVNQEAGNTDSADWTQEYCKLPVRAPGSDSDDFEGVQAAAGVLSGARGGITKPDGVDQADWDAAVKKAANEVISQYNANDETAPDGVYDAAGKELPERALSVNDVAMRLYEHMPEMAWLHDIYFDDEGGVFAVYSNEGRLYRMSVSISGDDVVPGMGEEVVIDFRPTSRTTVVRQANGRARWFSISSTAVLNRVGEIDSREMYDSFIQHAKETGEYPYRCFFHQGEQFRTGQCDFLARDGYVYITSGLYDDNDIAMAEIEALERDKEYWGESIKFMPTSPPEIVEIDGVEIPVYTRGVQIEVSLLPERKAAAWFTTVQEVYTMNEQIKAELLRLYGGDEERMSAFLSTVEETNRAIEDGELIARADGETVEDDEEEVETSNTETDVGDTEVETTEVEMDEETLSLIVEQVEQSVNARLDSITATLEQLARSIEDTAGAITDLDQRISQNATKYDQRLRELEVSEEEKIDRLAADMPKRSLTRVTYRPRHADKGNGKDDGPTIAERAEAIQWPDK